MAKYRWIKTNRSVLLTSIFRIIPCLPGHPDWEDFRTWVSAGGVPDPELPGTPEPDSTGLSLYANSVPVVSTTVGGVVPASGGGTSNFLRADGTWTAPPSGGTPDSVVIPVRNQTGVSIPFAAPVYLSGTGAGGESLVALARADNNSTLPAIGLTAAAIADGANGSVVHDGVLGGLDTSALTVGTVFYVAPAGGLTPTRPVAPNIIQKLCTVRTVGNPGTLLVVSLDGLVATGTANGYAGLDASALVPTAQLGTGTPNVTTFLRGDRTYASPTAAAAWGSITGTLSAQTDLQAALDAKQVAGNYEPANANIQAHVVSAHAPANAQANADITKAEIEAKLTGVIATHSHSGGSDPWTYVALAADFTTTSSTAVNVTGLTLVPSANLRYEIEGFFMLRTATTTVGPRPGCSWPTGMTDGTVRIDASNSATVMAIGSGNISAEVVALSTGLPNTTASWPATLWATMIAGATPGGSFNIRLRSETAGTTVTMKAGSWFRWRTF